MKTPIQNLKSTIQNPAVAWPLAIVALLLFGISTAVGTLVIAHSDGGAQVVEDYYQKAANWDAHAAEQAASQALGWRVTLTLASTPDAPHTTDLTIHDAQGQPVTDLAGTLRAFRPNRVGALDETSLSALPDAPGHYRQTLTLTERGLWDFEVIAQRDTLRFETVLRKEIF